MQATTDREQQIVDRILAGEPMTIGAAALTFGISIPMLVAMLKASFRNAGADVDHLTFHRDDQVLDAIAMMSVCFSPAMPPRAERRRAARNLHRKH